MATNTTERDKLTVLGIEFHWAGNMLGYCGVISEDPLVGARIWDSAGGWYALFYDHGHHGDSVKCSSPEEALIDAARALMKDAMKRVAEARHSVELMQSGLDSDLARFRLTSSILNDLKERFLGHKHPEDPDGDYRIYFDQSTGTLKCKSVPGIVHQVSSDGCHCDMCLIGRPGPDYSKCPDGCGCDECIPPKEDDDAD